MTMTDHVGSTEMLDNLEYVDDGPGVILSILLFASITFVFCIAVGYINLPTRKNKKENDNSTTTEGKCIVSNDLYPEIKSIMDNRDIVIDELVEIIKDRAWSVQEQESGDGYVENKSFDLIVENEPNKKNINRCVATYNMIKNIPGLINAKFSCLEPHSETSYNNDPDTRFHRVHVPLIVPEVHDDAIRLDIYDKDDNLIKMNWKSDYFVLNVYCYNQAFNATDYHRIVLLLDIVKR
jgi:aspartyl/asparaginyl beta-hydroxylase (cupin superfamily)